MCSTTVQKIEYTAFTFSGGEEQVRLTNIQEFYDCYVSKAITSVPLYYYYKIVIKAPFISSSQELIRLILLKNAIDNFFKSKNQTIECDLSLGYIPYARQDRVCYVGEAFSAEVMANLINSMEFKVVYVEDPHSNVITNLIKNCRIKSQLACFSETMPKGAKYDYIIAPDKGATEKAKRIASSLQTGFLQANKIRNPDTGNIEGIELEKAVDLTGRSVIIVDDICDGGRTFIELSKSLKPYSDHYNPATIDLYITHGIFSKGKEILLECFDNIYTHNEIQKENN